MITGKHPCEFCRNGRCEMCCSTGDGIICNAVPASASADRMWLCPCAAINHPDPLGRFVQRTDDSHGSNGGPALVLRAK